MSSTPPSESARLEGYWREHWRLILTLLAIWFVIAYVPPPFTKSLNSIQILTDFSLGYWLSTQLSITIFVILFFVYALTMNRVNKKYGFVEEE